MQVSILTKLKAEHQEARDLIEQIESSLEISRKKELFLMLEDLLLPHMEAEEKTLYLRLQDEVHDEEAEELAFFAKAEHEKVRILFDKLNNIGIERSEWDSTFGLARNSLMNHFQEEESEIFTEAKEDFSKDELYDIAEEYEDVKHHLNY